MDKETGQEEPEPSSAEKYYEQSYYQITHNHYYDMLHDNGKYGEYMIYEKLRNFEKSGGKFLFNCYLDRGNNKTTEIDVYGSRRVQGGGSSMDRFLQTL